MDAQGPKKPARKHKRASLTSAQCARSPIVGDFRLQWLQAATSARSRCMTDSTLPTEHMTSALSSATSANRYQTPPSTDWLLEVRQGR